MAEKIFFRATGEEVLANDLIEDQLGRNWKLSFAAKPGIRSGDPEGEIWVCRPDQGGQKAKPFAPYFFPEITFTPSDTHEVG